MMDSICNFPDMIGFSHQSSFFTKIKLSGKFLRFSGIMDFSLTFNLAEYIFLAFHAIDVCGCPK
jgi:hypothetical protein